MSLTSYLNHLDKQRRAGVVSGLERLDTDDRAELTAYLERLGKRIEHEIKFAETYMFAPAAWPSSALSEAANKWADPILRHMLVFHPDYVAVSVPAAVPIYREFNGVSDLWVIRIPSGFVGELDLDRSAALQVIGDQPLLVNGEWQRRAMPALLEGSQPHSLEAASTGNTLAVVVASPALVDSKPDGQWLTDRRAPATTTQQEPQKGRHGPRSGLAGHPGLPHSSSAAPLPPTATSQDRSRPR